MNLPTPANKSPILVNSYGEPTRHVYCRTEVIDVYTPDGDVDGQGYAFFFRCLKTKETRQFGLEDATAN